jgi:hypothetical protein
LEFVEGEQVHSVVRGALTKSLVGMMFELVHDEREAS